MGLVRTESDVKLHGEMTLITWDVTEDESGKHLVAQDMRVVDNIVCSIGLTVVLQGILWSSIEDQNANMGSPFNATFIAPIYGAVGTGLSVTTSVGDTQLAQEENRVVVTQAGYTPADNSGNGGVQWLFLFPAPASSQTITEAGVFVNATSTTGSGSLLDHAIIAPSITQSTTQLLTLSVNMNIA